MSKQREWNLFERTGESAHDEQWEVVRDEKGVCLAIPDHPALPAVARWLVGNTIAAVHLRRIANAAEAQINQDDREDYDPVMSARCRESLGVFRSLIAALTEGQG